jgi:uncharacterized phiE125 gp8 family phage protein
MLRTYPRKLVPETLDEPISLEEARSWLRMDIPDFQDDDSDIEAAVNAAVDYIERECNLSLTVSDYEWFTDCLPCEIRDTFYIRSITSIEANTDGVITAVDPVNYELIPASNRRAYIKWKKDFYSHSDHFVVKFKAGFELGEYPERLLMAVRALTSEFYHERGDGIKEKKTMVDRLLAPFIIPYAG